MGALRVLVADDHQLMLEAVRLALGEQDDIVIVGEAKRGREVLPKIASTDPDVILLDVRMPEMDGLTCLDLIRKRFPLIKVVMLSGSEDPDVIEAALRRGASAFVTKQIDPRDLASAIRQAVYGTVFQSFGSAEEAPVSAAKAAGLTDKELTVLRAVAKGLSNKHIASELWVSEQTIKFHLTNIYRKLDVANRTEAVHHAVRHRIIENPMFESSP
jgi:DNA-binding NarL/FixJ family response regulator